MQRLNYTCMHPRMLCSHILLGHIPYPHMHPYYYFFNLTDLWGDSDTNLNKLNTYLLLKVTRIDSLKEPKKTMDQKNVLI